MWDLELRELYLALPERLLYPTLPELVTNDGESLEFHKLVYDIDSAQAAFDALKHLDATVDYPDGFENALIAIRTRSFERHASTA